LRRVVREPAVDDHLLGLGRARWEVLGDHFSVRGWNDFAWDL
jgi:hypothetical protein